MQRRQLIGKTALLCLETLDRLNDILLWHYRTCHQSNGGNACCTADGSRLHFTLEESAVMPEQPQVIARPCDCTGCKLTHAGDGNRLIIWMHPAQHTFPKWLIILRQTEHVVHTGRGEHDPAIKIDQIHGLKRVFDAQFDSRRQMMHSASLGGSLAGK